MFVTRRAKNLITGKLRDLPPSSIEDMDDIIREFDQTTKLAIRNADEPVYLKLGNPRYNNPKLNIKRGALKLSG